MRPVRSWVIYLAVVFLGGALLAPWLYWAAQWGAENFTSLHGLAGKPFHRYVNRALLGLALAGLWPLLKGLGLRSWREVGLGKPEWGKVAAGFAAGFVSLAVVAAGAVLAGARTIQVDAARVGHIAGSAALTAALVAVLEEVVFRGALFGGLRKSFHWKPALLVSSAGYALVHFFERTEYAAPVRWTSGLELLPQMLRGFGDVQMLVPGFFNLTLAGLILGLAYQRTGNLYASIGLHAGWIFWLKSYGAFTRPVAEANVWLWGTHKLVDGWIALVVLLGCGLAGVFLKWSKPKTMNP